MAATTCTDGGEPCQFCQRQRGPYKGQLRPSVVSGYTCTDHEVNSLPDLPTTAAACVAHPCSKRSMLGTVLLMAAMTCAGAVDTVSCASGSGSLWHRLKGCLPMLLLPAPDAKQI